MTVNEKIKSLRTSMAKHGVNAIVIPSSDPHMSEYLPDHWKARNYFSGFTGSAGTLVVTETESGLWTDGRYFVQAAKELDGSEIVLYRMGVKDVPTISCFLADKLANGKVLGIDGSVTSLALYKQYEKALSDVGSTIKSVPCISEAWENRPEIPASEVYLHELKYTGLSSAQKIAALREK
ncbi:MAG: aminopeptidase P family N-terminal domain-containing protein, partial [Oscillospiraceae bacterium]